MPTDYGRFGLTVPNDTDSPNGPLNFRDLVDDLEKRLGYAGAQGGISKNAAPQGRTNTAYGVLGTPDRVQGLVLPANGLLLIQFQCEWQQTVASTASAAIFVNGVPANAQIGGAAAGSTSTAYKPMGTALVPGGLADQPNIGTLLTQTIVAPQDDTQGIPLGTYEVNVQFKSTSGTVNVRNRLLRAWVKEFPATGI